MVTMATRKPDQDGRARSRKMKRKGIPVAARLPDSLYAAFTAYQKSLEFPPDNAAVVIAALRDFLAEKGFFKE